MTENPATQMLEAAIGMEHPGGCDQCNARQTIRRESEAIYRMTVAHDDDCPMLHFHRHVAPLRAQLKNLREQWAMWNDMDLEELARREDLDLEAIMPEANGDRVLAARAWRAGILASLEVLGAATLAQLKAAEGES